MYFILRNATPQKVCDKQMSLTEEKINHCLRLAIFLMEDLDYKDFTPQLQSLYDTLILSNIGSKVEETRPLAVKAVQKFFETAFGQFEKMPEYLEEPRKHVKKNKFCSFFK